PLGSAPARHSEVSGDISSSSGTAPWHGWPVAARSRTGRPDNPPRPAAGRGSPLFFGEVLEHLLVEHQLGDQPLEPLDLALQLAAAAVGGDLDGVVALAPAIVGRLGDAELATDVGDRQSLGQVPVGLAEQARHLVGSPSFRHGPLLGSVYRRLSFQVDQFLGSRPGKAALPPYPTIGSPRPPAPPRGGARPLASGPHHHPGCVGAGGPLVRVLLRSAGRIRPAAGRCAVTLPGGLARGGPPWLP